MTKSDIFNKIPQNTDFYFIHSYSFIPTDTYVISATTNYHKEIVSLLKKQLDANKETLSYIKNQIESYLKYLKLKKADKPYQLDQYWKRNFFNCFKKKYKS